MSDTAQITSCKSGKIMSAGMPGDVPNAGQKRNMKAGHGYLGHFAKPSVLRKGHNTTGHPGFASVQRSIAAKEGISEERAGAILAASSRGASKAAKKANPRLNRVKG